MEMDSLTQDIARRRVSDEAQRRDKPMTSKLFKREKGSKIY